jgi:hypothetical protein
MFRWISKLISKTEPVSYQVTESIYGLWHYHISKNSAAEALCGAKVMRTDVSLDNWGTRTHLKEHWCLDCARIMKTETKENAK